MNEQPIPPQPQLPSQPPSKTPSIIALVLGIIAMLFGVVSVISVPLAVAAIVLGIIGIRKKAGKGLAIGGIVTGSIGLLIGLLIVPLMIFVALPSLQDNQSDTQVKNDVASAISGINTFQANNRGALPTAEQFEGGAELEYAPGLSCNGTAGERLYSVSAPLADGERYCLDG